MDVKPDRILWPTDFSDLSLKGGRYAYGLCSHFDAQLQNLPRGHRLGELDDKLRLACRNLDDLAHTDRPRHLQIHFSHCRLPSRG